MIAEGQIPSHKIYEDDVCVAFLDLSQANIGHTLIVPKKHFSNIIDLDNDVAGHLFSVTSKLTKAISKAFNVSDFNILNNCGEVAGQTVHHFHIHIIPRKLNDNIKIELSSNKLTDEEFINVKNAIIEQL
jgi:histidine triad (HIT) family protein